MNAEVIAQLIIAGCDEAEKRIEQAVAGAPGIIRAGLDAVRVGTIIGLIISAIGVVVSVTSLVMAFTNSSSRNADLADTLTASPALQWPRSSFAS